MIQNGKISYFELEQLTHIIRGIIVGSYFKKIYHYNGLWLLKFNHYSFIFEPGEAARSWYIHRKREDSTFGVYKDT